MATKKYFKNKFGVTRTHGCNSICVGFIGISLFSHNVTDNPSDKYVPSTDVEFEDGVRNCLIKFGLGHLLK